MINGNISILEEIKIKKLELGKLIADGFSFSDVIVVNKSEEINDLLLCFDREPTKALYLYH